MDETKNQTHSQNTEQLLAQSIDVLRANDRGTHTMPSTDIYPHQWLWDSCFAAIGWAQIDIKRAQQEVYSLFKGQWSNGMIPHMIFDMSPKYSKDRNAWRSWVSPSSPDDVATSGITQPPIIAEAVSRIGSKLTKIDRQKYYKKVLPKLIKYHEWFYAERDPRGDGLVLQIHPYETGFDNTPPWMDVIREHNMPWWINMVQKLKLDPLINVARRDTRRLPPEQRMKNIDALVIWDDVLRLRRKKYEIDKILHRSLFIINDVSFNSIFVRNNTILRDLANTARIKLPKELINNMTKSEDSLNSLWDETFHIYFSRDYINNKLIKSPTIAGLMPLYAGTIKPEHAKKLVQDLMNNHAFWLKYPVPSVPRNVRTFDQYRYWQGPTWVNTNWLIIDGLLRMGFAKEAQQLKTKTISMIDENGIWEYYNPLNGQGLGDPNFSWTAALTIDLLSSN